MTRTQPVCWQLPPGVTRGTHDYVHLDTVSDDYDRYFEGKRLFDLDCQIVSRHIEASNGQVIADLGCGTGRALIQLVKKGARGWAIDLSENMLRIVQGKADAEALDIQCIRANLVQLDGLADNSVDGAICLFSTLGMIHGSENRQRALDQTRRILKSGGKFIVHVHNYWAHLTDPDGPKWIVQNLLRSVWAPEIERGDRYFPYRGVPNMYLHTFTCGELKRLLYAAGFRPLEWTPLDPSQGGALTRPWLFGALRASGWIVACE